MISHDCRSPPPPPPSVNGFKQCRISTEALILTVSMISSLYGHDFVWLVLVEDIGHIVANTAYSAVDASQNLPSSFPGHCVEGAVQSLASYSP
jgi:hypothetical protein